MNSQILRWNVVFYLLLEFAVTQEVVNTLMERYNSNALLDCSVDNDRAIRHNISFNNVLQPSDIFVRFEHSTNLIRTIRSNALSRGSFGLLIAGNDPTDCKDLNKLFIAER